MSTAPEELEESLAFAHCYWQWGSEPETQYRLTVLAREIERLQAELDGSNPPRPVSPRPDGPRPPYPEF